MSKGGKRKGAGRKLGLTAATADELVAAAERGGYVSTIARSVGVPVSTLRRWLARGRQLREGEDDADLNANDVACIDLATRLDRAFAECELSMMDTIFAAARDGDWRAASHLLSIRFDPSQADSAEPAALPSPDLSRALARIDKAKAEEVDEGMPPVMKAILDRITVPEDEREQPPIVKDLLSRVTVEDDD